MKKFFRRGTLAFGADFRYLSAFLYRLYTKIRKFFLRSPAWFRRVPGPLVGAAAGLLGGIAGVVIGLILGYLLQELFRQFHNDREALRYFNDPGFSDFYEGEPGLAAFCALGILVVSGASSSLQAETITAPVVRKAMQVFYGTAADPFGTVVPALTENFCRQAFSCRKSLNLDLLTESLISRRSKKTARPALRDLGKALWDLAADASGMALDTASWAAARGADFADIAEAGQKARDIAASIRGALDPSWNEAEEAAGLAVKDDDAEAWRVLGLSPGAPPDEVKSHYRKLAMQFHPDSLAKLSPEQQAAATEAFIAIKEAYKKILG
jgi:uncharacterized membrane protein